MLGAHAPLRQQTVRALRECALEVLDIEVVRLKPGLDLDGLDPLLEAGAELGARHLLCTVEDPDTDRAVQAWSELCVRASGYGLRCMLEFMIFSAVSTLQQAVAIVRAATAAGAPQSGVLVDALHLFRSGGSPDEVASVDPALLPYLQLC